MNRKFVVECEMEDRWVNQFISFLKYMERNGEIGHSVRVGFFSDGDGDFKPKFTTDTEYEIVDAPITYISDMENEELFDIHCYNEVTFDAK